MRRLKAIAIIWWLLAASPLLVSLTVKWFSLSVALAIAMRAGLGVYAWKKANTGLSVVVRLVVVLAPLLIFAGGVFFERMEVPVHQPSPFGPEWVLPRRGEWDGRAWFGDRDNPSMFMMAALALELLLGLTVAASRATSAPPVRSD
ncbi:MAG: hypothetical protein QM817_38360 [Archangium sp.]